ncbi:hypothetical protein GCM10017673_44440 [Streptosporangium violaceochromogenes]|nr:hypothetical protein GCM10017673_44440 [Streptosporangium violaceochromogenes]
MLLCGALALTACSGTETTAPAHAPDSSPSAAATAATRPSNDATIVSANDLCDYLRGRLPALRAIGSKVGRMGNLTVNLYSWYEKQGAVPTGAQIDDQTQKECPDIRAELLKISGMQSFATL